MPIPSERPDDPRRFDVPAESDAPDERAFAPGPPRSRRALATVADALGAAPLSMDAVRDAAVRYGSAARVLAIGPDELVDGVRALLRRHAARHAPAVRAELETSVPWWAIHGYHRAD